jgi:tol-pal system protein YbgF
MFAAALLIGALAGTLLAPQPADAVSKEIIQLQQQVSQILQAQRDMQSSADSNFATIKTLLNQSVDAVNHLNNSMGALQKTVQDVQANTGARMDSMSTQVQGLSDSLDDMKSRMSKLSQQLADTQGVLQSLDARVSGGAPMPGGATGTTNPGNPGGNSGNSSNTANPGGPGANTTPGAAPPSADVLYNSALRDFVGGNYDLAHQEFLDYLKYYPTMDLASNAQFYLGEIAYAQGQYRMSIDEYDRVLTNYPKSYKLAAARLKKGYAELELGQKSSGIRELREVIRRFPGSEEERRARAKLREMGVPVTGH